MLRFNETRFGRVRGVPKNKAFPKKLSQSKEHDEPSGGRKQRVLRETKKKEKKKKSARAGLEVEGIMDENREEV